MPVAVVGIAAYAGATAAGYAVGTAIAVGVVAAASTQAYMNSITPEMGDFTSDPVSDQALTTNANQARKIIYGEGLVGGQIVGYALPTINKEQYHIMVLNLAGHPCESVSIYEIEGKTVAELGDAVQMNVHLGDQVSADSLANTYVDGWTTDHIGYNQTYVVLKIRADSELFPSGVNECKFIVRGKKVYDPRKDDTEGGSGAHRAEDPTTWEWSDNPSLCAYDWLRFHGARPVPLRRIPWDFVALTANYCAEAAIYTDSDGNSASGQRFGCNGVLTNSVNPGEGLSQIMSTMGAAPYRVGGKIYIKPAMYAGPATVTVAVNEAMEMPSYRPHRPLRELTNLVRPEYVAPRKKWQLTSAPIVKSQAYIDKDGSVLESTIRLKLVTKDHQAQRLAKLKLERNRAGFQSSYPLPGLRLDIVPGNNINFVDVQTGINKEFLVEDAKFDAAKNVTNLQLVEDGPTIYPDDFEPAEGDLTPNTTLPDATAIVPPNAVNYAATPADDYRQGVLTWDHAAPASVINYIVLITNQNGTPAFTQSYTPVALSQDLANIPLGSYHAAVAAKNRFKPSVATQIAFNIGQPTTPTASPTVDLLPGRVIITGPELPHSDATYEWKFLFEDTFDDALNGGRTDVLTVTNTPHEGTLYVWYRIVDRGVPDPTWLQVVVPNLIGISDQEVTPELIGGLTLPGLPQTLLDTISGVTSDINNWSQQTGQLGGDYSTLLYNVTEATGAAAANYLDIIAVKELVGTTSVTAQITEFKNVQIGYEDPQTGDWVEGAAFAQAFNEVRITDADENELSIHQFFEALETRTGLLEGKVQLGVAVEGSFTGIEILAGESGLSSFRLFMDELIFASRAGEIAYEYLAAYGRHIWYGATVKIGATEMIVEDLEAPFGPDNLAYWRGPTTLNMGVPDFDNLTKANANEWRAPNGEWYRTGKATLAAPELTIVDSNGDPLIEYDSVADTIKNYGTFYAANIIGGLYGSINKTVTQPANAVSTTHQTFLTVTAAGQIVGGTFDRILKSEPLRLTWTSPNNVDTATFVVDVLVDGAVVATASQFATSPSGADMSVTFSIPAFLVDVPAKTTDTSIEFRVSSTAATAGPTTITGQADGGVVNLSVFKTDGSLS